jgi:RNA polymerase sigma-70 factor (ECF subfamily)
MAQRGAIHAMGELFDPYREYLRMLAQLQLDRRLRQKVDASDNVQEVCLKAHRYFAEFRTSPSLIDATKPTRMDPRS